MAEITYDPTPVDQQEFSAEELDSLQVGEQLQQAEQQMLAGKYENAGDRPEKAYLELQQKLGERHSDAEQAEPGRGAAAAREEGVQEEVQEGRVLRDEEQLVLDATAEWDQNW